MTNVGVLIVALVGAGALLVWMAQVAGAIRELDRRISEHTEIMARMARAQRIIADVVLPTQPSGEDAREDLEPDA